MAEPRDTEITRALHDVERGALSADELLSLVYTELRRVAAARQR